jgi:hypothetical protein
LRKNTDGTAVYSLYCKFFPTSSGLGRDDVN